MIKIQKEKDKGFTLLELLVVVVILVVLAAIAVVVFGNQRAKALDAAAQSNIATIGNTIANSFSLGVEPQEGPGGTTIIVDDQEATGTQTIALGDATVNNLTDSANWCIEQEGGSGWWHMSAGEQNPSGSDCAGNNAPGGGGGGPGGGGGVPGGIPNLTTALSFDPDFPEPTLANWAADTDGQNEWFCHYAVGESWQDRWNNDGSETTDVDPATNEWGDGAQVLSNGSTQVGRPFLMVEPKISEIGVVPAPQWCLPNPAIQIDVEDTGQPENFSIIALVWFKQPGEADWRLLYVETANYDSGLDGLAVPINAPSRGEDAAENGTGLYEYRVEVFEDDGGPSWTTLTEDGWPIQPNQHNDILLDSATTSFTITDEPPADWCYAPGECLQRAG